MDWFIIQEEFQVILIRFLKLLMLTIHEGTEHFYTMLVL